MILNSTFRIRIPSTPWALSLTLISHPSTTTTTMATMTRVYYLLIDPEKSPIGNLCSVTVPEDGTVTDLADKIKEHRPHALAHVDAGDLILWKRKEGGSDEDLEECIKNFSKLSDDVEYLNPKMKVANLHLDEMLLVQVPSALHIAPFF